MKYTTIIVAATAILAIGASYANANPVAKLNVKLSTADKISGKKSSNLSMEEEMLCLLNTLRNKHNRPPLGLDSGLVRASKEHSQAQANANTMTHQLSGQRSV